jgi:osmoprotectant transport system ATP-binding protein
LPGRFFIDHTVFLETAVEFQEVSLAYNGRPILANFSLAIARGETVALLGRSGSGKTTALRLIPRLIAPTSGRVLVDGRDVRDWDLIDLRRRIGYVNQSGGLFPHLTVMENVSLVARVEKRPDHQVRAAEVLRTAGLDPLEFANRYPHQLSGGQRQRAGVARALMLDPPILLFDEPFSALDPVLRLGLQRQFAELRARLNKTAVFVTHDLHEAERVGDRIALLAGGKLDSITPAREFALGATEEARAFQEAFCPPRF